MFRQCSWNKCPQTAAKTLSGSKNIILQYSQAGMSMFNWKVQKIQKIQNVVLWGLECKGEMKRLVLFWSRYSQWIIYVASSFAKNDAKLKQSTFLSCIITPCFIPTSFWCCNWPIIGQEYFLQHSCWFVWQFWMILFCFRHTLSLSLSIDLSLLCCISLLFFDV